MPDPDPTRVRHVVGCMTGTSLDGLDVALTRIGGTGLGMTAEFVALHSVPLPATLRRTLRSLAEGTPHAPLDIMRAARHLGVLHAGAVATLLAQHPTVTVDFVVAHGQTLWHAPADRLSWQLFDPWPLVRTLGLPVCYDLRQADLVAGGEGAPITPIADPILYPGPTRTVVINLGGIVNLTAWQDADEQCPRHAPLAEDVCPGNLLIDGLVRRLFPGRRYDMDGMIAAGGDSDLETERFLSASLPRRRDGTGSLGVQHCSAETLDAIIAGRPHVQPATLIRAALHMVAARISAACDAYGPARVILAGGGARNPVLVDAIRAVIAGYETDDIRLSDELGIPCEAREAVAFAVLGALSQDGVPITLPRVTGATDPGVAGVWANPHPAPQTP